LLGQLAKVYRDLNQLDQALALIDQIDNPALKNDLLADIAKLYSSAGQPEKALALYQQALDLAKTLDDPLVQGKTLTDSNYKYEIGRKNTDKRSNIQRKR
jgi:tetratricopeptide (TPR) repeat protein